MPSRTVTRTVARSVIGVGVAGVFVYLAFGRQDLSEMLAVLKTTRLDLLAIAVVVLAAGFVVRGARWWTMLRSVNPKVRFSSCISPFLGSYAVNNVLPLRAGDLLRTFGFRGRLGCSASGVLGTLAVERLLDVLTLLGLLGLGLMLLPAGRVNQAFVLGCAALFVFAFAAVACLTFAPSLLIALVRWGISRSPLRRWSISHRLAAAAEQFINSASMLRNPRTAAALLTLSVLGWLLEGTVFLLAARSMQIETALPGPYFAMVTATLGTMVPSTPGYVGTFDYFAILGLEAFGAQPTAAAAFALLVHLLLWLPVTCAGGLLLFVTWGRGTIAELRSLPFHTTGTNHA